MTQVLIEVWNRYEKRSHMNIRSVILCLALLLPLPVFGRENTDVIVMKNGDRLTGQIKGLSGDVLYISLPYVIQTLSFTVLR